MKKSMTCVLMLLLAISLLAACASNPDYSAPAPVSLASNAPVPTTSAPNAPASNNFKVASEITVVSREDGSGTRGAFIELFGVEVKDADGNKKDMTTKEAVIANKTGVMMTNIANDPYAIGYISLGSLDNTVKALDIDGVKASTDNVKNGSYKISRPFMIATKGQPAGLAKDFVDFILSKEGQEIVAAGGYIAIDDNAPAYAGNKPSGKITVGGSSSVTPIMEKLQEAYLALNPAAVIEIQLSDSTNGMNGAMDGTFDIGMASRELKDSEKEQLADLAIALDGIAVIVNLENPLAGVAGEQVRGIFTGEIDKWNGI
ncbi:MAG: substrate-binding domain-containing protein [Clostridiales bacterium]|nr:substrate-binding domain-containing protein [Clostridiales bacterium]